MPARVWDSFLTEQDRAHLALSKHRDIGFGERPALLLIDLYRWVFGDKPEPLLEAIKTWPSSCGLAGWQALPSIQTLLQVAREASIPIVHLTGLDQDGVPGWSGLGRAHQGGRRGVARRRIGRSTSRRSPGRLRTAR